MEKQAGGRSPLRVFRRALGRQTGWTNLIQLFEGKLNQRPQTRSDQDNILRAQAQQLMKMIRVALLQTPRASTRPLTLSKREIIDYILCEGRRYRFLDGGEETTFLKRDDRTGEISKLGRARLLDYGMTGQTLRELRFSLGILPAELAARTGRETTTTGTTVKSTWESRLELGDRTNSLGPKTVHRLGNWKQPDYSDPAAQQQSLCQIYWSTDILPIASMVSASYSRERLGTIIEDLLHFFEFQNKKSRIALREVSPGVFFRHATMEELYVLLSKGTSVLTATAPKSRRTLIGRYQNGGKIENASVARAFGLLFHIRGYTIRALSENNCSRNHDALEIRKAMSKLALQLATNKRTLDEALTTLGLDNRTTRPVLDPTLAPLQKLFSSGRVWDHTDLDPLAPGITGWRWSQVMGSKTENSAVPAQ